VTGYAELTGRKVIPTFAASSACLFILQGTGTKSIPLAERNIWIGAYAPPAPWISMVAVTNLERSIGRRLDIVHIYTAWGEEWGAYNGETVRQLHSATSNGRRALITWEPWVLGQGADQDKFALRRIAAGSFDDYIRRWARGLRDFPSITYLRPMHEMNGDWYSWCIGVNGNSVGDYIRAWRRMWVIFAQEQVSNVRWIWCPYAADSSASNMFELAYPGDRYVDLLGLDVYNWGTGARSDCKVGESNMWRTVTECLAPSYRRISSLASQPIWLPEIGCAEQGGDKSQWFRDLLDSPDYGRISALVFFDADKERDWRVTASTSSRTAVARSLEGTTPAAEAAIAPTPPFEVQATRGSNMIEISWSTIEDGSGLDFFAICVFLRNDVVGTVLVGPQSRNYFFLTPDQRIQYSFAVRTVNRFGASAMSPRTTPT
jgi:beta-mannanase